MNFVVIGKDGWPVELIIGRPVTNFIRCLLHGRGIISRAKWNVINTPKPSCNDFELVASRKGPEIRFF